MKRTARTIGNACDTSVNPLSEGADDARTYDHARFEGISFPEIHCATGARSRGTRPYLRQLRAIRTGQLERRIPWLSAQQTPYAGLHYHCDTKLINRWCRLRQRQKRLHEGKKIKIISQSGRRARNQDDDGGEIRVAEGSILNGQHERTGMQGEASC